MRISYCTRVGMEGRKVGEQAAVMGVSKCGGHRVAHGRCGSQRQVQACRGAGPMAAGTLSCCSR